MPTVGAMDLYVDRKALRPGDLLTIRLEEQTRSSKSSETSIRKQSSKELPNPRIFGNTIRGTGPETLLQSIDDSTDFDAPFQQPARKSKPRDQERRLTTVRRTCIGGVAVALSRYGSENPASASRPTTAAVK